MTTELDFTTFETAIGWCGIVWSERGIVRVLIPERRETAARSAILRRHEGARAAKPPAEIQSAIDDIVGLLAGRNTDLSQVQIDLDGVPEFNCRVYDIARRIGAGATLSYGEIAERLGDRNLARDVAQALSQNPLPIIVPCHRVLAAGGKLGGFSAPGGVRTKARLLTIEGAHTGEATLFGSLPWVTAPRRA